MNSISAVIVVKDNPPHLSETLTSLDFVDEIVIIDIGITDECKKILNDTKKTKIIQIHQSIPYVELIREKSKEYASHEFIIFMDPDEVITSDLKEEIINNINNYNYISIPRKNIIFGKWIQHSRWWPDYQIRVFKRNNVTWPERLHAQPEVQGSGYTIEATEGKALLHYNYESVSEYLLKMIRYSKAEAQENIHKKTNLTLGDALKKSLQEFISRYFAEKGYKDGMHGTVLAFLQMFYCLLVYFFYWEATKNTSHEDKNQAIEVATHFKQTLYETTYWIDKEKLGTQRDRIKIRILNSLLKRM